MGGGADSPIPSKRPRPAPSPWQLKASVVFIRNLFHKSVVNLHFLLARFQPLSIFLLHLLCPPFHAEESEPAPCHFIPGAPAFGSPDHVSSVFTAGSAELGPIRSPAASAPFLVPLAQCRHGWCPDPGLSFAMVTDWRLAFLPVLRAGAGCPVEVAGSQEGRACSLHWASVPWNCSSGAGGHTVRGQQGFHPKMVC